MIAAISWVPKGVTKSVPTVADPPSKEEIEEILKSGVLEAREESENEEADDNMNDDALSQDDELSHALSAANALGKALKTAKPETDSLTEALKELDMDKYDEEDDGAELFGSGLSNLYYASNDMDPYLKNGDEDSEEEEDITIKPEDGVIVCARNEDDVSHLEVWIMEDPTDVNSNMYVHHVIVIPAFPLCTAWLDCPIKGGEKGNFIAVGSMEPAIEIWDLDMDEVQPSATLGGVVERRKRERRNLLNTRMGATQIQFLDLLGTRSIGTFLLVQVQTNWLRFGMWQLKHVI